MVVRVVFSISCAIKNLLTAIALLKAKAILYSFVPISSECHLIQGCVQEVFFDPLNC